MIGTIALSPRAGASPAAAQLARASAPCSRAAGRPAPGSSRARRARGGRCRRPSAAARSRTAAGASAARARRRAPRRRRRSPRRRPPSALPSVPVTITSRSPSSAEALEHPAAGLADHPDPVRVVDDQGRPVLGGDRGELGDRRQVALHAEHAVGDDQPPLASAAPRRARGAGRRGRRARRRPCGRGGRAGSRR